MDWDVGDPGGHSTGQKGEVNIHLRSRVRNINVINKIPTQAVGLNKRTFGTLPVEWTAWHESFTNANTQ